MGFSIAAQTTGLTLLPPKTNPCTYLLLLIFPKVIQHLSLDARALVRLQSDHINRTLVPAFYRYLQAQDPSSQIEDGKEFLGAIEGLVILFERAEKEGEVEALGLWKEGGEIGWADVMAGPCEQLPLPPSSSH